MLPLAHDPQRVGHAENGSLVIPERRREVLNRRTLVLIAVGGWTTCLVAADVAQAACDLEATFTAPAGTPVAGGGPVTWTLQYRNVGNQACSGNQVKLQRYTGTTASGYGSQVGGSGASQTLIALGPDQAQSLSFTEQAAPTSGTYTYKPGCSSPCNDANNTNQYPTRTVTFTGSVASQSPPDLQITGISVSAPRVGACNTARVSFRNNGAAINQNWRLTLTTHPTGNPFQDKQTYTLTHGAIATGQSATREFKKVNLVPNATAQSVADSGQAIAESSEDNNIGTQSFNGLTTCP
jgi:hypothetical protein